jgi:hypothetical protein
MTQVTLVTGNRTSLREAAIAARIDPTQRTAVILEGLPDGNGLLHQSPDTSNPRIVRIAPGCMHCIGNLVMRVTLNRLLREQPDFLYISVASDEHLELLRQFLRSPPYDSLLTVRDDIVCSPTSTRP